MKSKISLFFGVLCAMFLAFDAVAYQIIETNLPTIVSNSSVAFRGKCESREVKTVEQGTMTGVVTHYVFTVTEVMKGEIGNRFEFDVWGATRADAKKTGAPYAVGFVQFDPGREYVVFLTGPTDLGVYAPMGMALGVFNVTYSAEGRAMVVNSFKNSNLFKGAKSARFTKAIKAANIDEKSPPAGPLPYDDFKKMVDVLK